MRAHSWWSTPNFRDPNSAEQGQIAYALLRAGTLASAALLTSAPFLGQPLRSALNYALFFLLHVAHLFLLRRGYVQLAVRSFCLCYFVLITLILVQFGGIRGPAGFVYPPLVLVAGLMWSSQAAIGFAIACALSGLVLASLEHAHVWHGEVVSVERLWSVMAAVLFITAITLHVALSALRRARTEAFALQARLDRAERFEALGRLAGGVAHDFNNQLSVMLAHTELLRSSSEVDTRSAESLGIIEAAVQHAGDLTRQLLEFGRQRVLEPSVIDVRETLSGMHNLLNQSLGARVTLRTRYVHGALKVRMDRTALERVVVNLILNARDAMPEGGDVLLSVGRVSAAQPRRDFIEISVRDHGIGMDETTRSRIFEPFFTTKPQGQGTGLGLSSVLGVVAQSGGEIDVESAPGQGTQFRILLPAAEPATEAPTAAATAAASGRLGLKLLLVEDQALIRRALHTSLAQAGFEVIPARSLDDALHQVAALDKPLDLLVTDVMLPDGDGLHLLAQLRATLPSLRAVVVSGQVRSELALAFTNDANTLLLHKPFTLQDLMNKLRQLVALGRA
jgi:signal transduction histidine kinase/CheY-like chemotaxis protein